MKQTYSWIALAIGLTLSLVLGAFSPPVAGGEFQLWLLTSLRLAIHFARFGASGVCVVVSCDSPGFGAMVCVWNRRRRDRITAAAERGGM